MTTLKQLLRSHPWWTSVFLLAMVLGAALRLLWGSDIEYKGDESWMFARTQAIGKTESLPWLGLPSSSLFQHPGLNVWIFWAMSEAIRATEPPNLARGVQVLSLMAMALYVLFVMRLVPANEREPWWWGLALMALSPIAVLMQRKIWQPSIFPIFTLFWLIGWWRRGQRGGAFLWGLLGALLGQIHLSGLFFAFGFATFACLFDRRQVRWRWWLAGSVLGSLTLLPWLDYMLHRPPGMEARGIAWHHLVNGAYWFRWLNEAFGISAQYALDDNFYDFLRYPFVGDQPTYLMLALHGFIACVLIGFLFHGGRRLWQRRAEPWLFFADRSSPTAFTLQAALWGYGLCLNFLMMPIHRHYMTIIMPLGFVWLARSMLSGQRFSRAVLASLCVAQAAISLQMLRYIHVNQHALRCEFGLPFGTQLSIRPDAAWHPVPFGDAGPPALTRE